MSDPNNHITFIITTWDKTEEDMKPLKDALAIRYPNLSYDFMIMNDPNGKEYFLSTDLSGVTSSENVIKQTFTYSNLYSYIARNSKSIINEFRFELNSPENRQLITRNLNNLLENIKLNGGIESYNVICNEINNTETTIAQNILIVDLSFKPIQSPSIINLNFTT